MSKTVNIVLTGRVLSGFSHDRVLATLAKLLKLDEAEAASRLAGKESVLREGVPAELANRHIQILKESGIEARIGNIPRTDPPAAEPVADMSEPTASPPAPKLELLPMDKPDNGSETWQKPATSAPTSGGNGYSSRSHLPAGISVIEQETPPFVALSTKGRIGRLRFLAWGWTTTLLIVLLALLFMAMSGVLKPGDPLSVKPSGLSLILAAIIGLAAIWVSLRVTVLRLHDLNLSGFWLLAVLLLPAIAGVMHSSVLAIVFAIATWVGAISLVFLPGSEGTNDYGSSPGDNTLFVYIGAGLAILLNLVGVLNYSRLIYLQHPGASVQSVGQTAQRAGSMEEAGNPVYAEVRVKGNTPKGAFEMAIFAKATDLSDCDKGIHILENVLTPGVKQGCPTCAVVKSECTPDLMSRYVKLFDNEPSSLTYVSMGRGSETEREVRMIIWGVTVAESNAICSALVPNIQKTWSGAVRCVRPL